jgi:hypothetical protein
MITATDPTDGISAGATITVIPQLTLTGKTITVIQGDLIPSTQVLAQGTDANPCHTVPSPCPLAGPLHAVINWGGGTVETGFLVPGQGGLYSVLPRDGTHEFRGPGTYTITIDVSDLDTGAHATTTSTFIVNTKLTLTGTTFTIPQGVVIHDTHAQLLDASIRDMSIKSININWGDSDALDTGILVGGAGGVFSVATGPAHGHQYTSTGTFTITIHLEDFGIGALLTTTSTVTVTPQFALTPVDFPIVQGVPIPASFSLATLTDANTADTATSAIGPFSSSPWSITISWGDGSPAWVGQLSGGNGSFSVLEGGPAVGSLAQKLYDSPGTFDITIQVTDPQSTATVTTKSKVTVTAP